jgi:hypothetical protein
MRLDQSNFASCSAGRSDSLLFHKGMAYSQAHGDIAFTVPLFEGFMKRIMRLEV